MHATKTLNVAVAGTRVSIGSWDSSAGSFFHYWAWNKTISSCMRLAATGASYHIRVRTIRPEVVLDGLLPSVREDGMQDKRPVDTGDGICFEGFHFFLFSSSSVACRLVYNRKTACFRNGLEGE